MSTANAEFDTRPTHSVTVAAVKIGLAVLPGVALLAGASRYTSLGRRGS